MSINDIFKEMFSEKKRERELKFQQEIIRNHYKIKVIILMTLKKD